MTSIKNFLPLDLKATQGPDLIKLPSLDLTRVPYSAGRSSAPPANRSPLNISVTQTFGASADRLDLAGLTRSDRPSPHHATVQITPSTNQRLFDAFSVGKSILPTNTLSLSTHGRASTLAPEMTHLPVPRLESSKASQSADYFLQGVLSPLSALVDRLNPKSNADPLRSVNKPDPDALGHRLARVPSAISNFLNPKTSADPLNYGSNPDKAGDLLTSLWRPETMFLVGAVASPFNKADPLAWLPFGGTNKAGGLTGGRLVNSAAPTRPAADFNPHAYLGLEGTRLFANVKVGTGKNAIDLADALTALASNSRFGQTTQVAGRLRHESQFANPMSLSGDVIRALEASRPRVGDQAVVSLLNNHLVLASNDFNSQWLRRYRDDLVALNTPPAPARPRSADLPQAKLASTPLASIPLGQRLDQGASSNVYLIKNDPNSVAVVLKNADPKHPDFSSTRNPEVAAQFADQINYMGSIHLRHDGHAIAPEIRRTLVDDKGHLIGYVVEKIDGRDLKHALTHGQLKGDDIARVVKQVEDQLAQLHRQGLIHGDINPGNVIITGNPPVARLVDFEPPKPNYGVADEMEQLGRFREDVSFYSSPRVIENTRRAEALAHAQRQWSSFLDIQRPKLDVIRVQMNAYKRSLEGAPEALLDAISSIQTQLRLNNRPAHLIKPDDFARAAEHLAPGGALMTQLRELSNGLPTGMRQRFDEMVDVIKAVQRQWAQVPRMPD
ncbi:MAG TPA: phosphotransferase [Burkholderiaceae bacterium]|nr:phosphotransferase [Burkholderiaceae bacterium]